MPARMDFEFNFRRPEGAHRREEAPFRLLLIADLGGRAARGVAETGDALAARAVPRVDVDTFDAFFARVAPAVPFTLDGGVSGVLEPRALDDFHPDHLFGAHPLFGPFREARARLLDPSTSLETAALLGAGEAAPPPAPAAEDEGATLERLLGKRPERPTAETAARRGLDRFLREAVRPFIVPTPDPRRDDFVRAVDEAAGSVLRAVLHHPAVREVEASWRALHRLVTSLETGEELRVHVLDVSRDELFADLRAAGLEPARSGLHRLLVEQDASTRGGAPWSVLAAALTFRPAREDAGFAAALAAVAAAAGGPFLAAAHPSFLGVDRLPEFPDPARFAVPAGEGAEAWRKLAASPWARWIGLALPRVLSRYPWGGGGEAVETVGFEELPPGSSIEDAPWGPPAPYVAELLARAYAERGWEMEPGDLLDVEDLPAFARTVEGERRLLPAAEAWLGERGAEAVLARGLIPLVSYRDRGAVRVLRVQSIASPAAALAGPWETGR